ncbi:MAG: hypothetical protein ACFBSG_06100 [Leptolyngbyaceae cyanobacterium]
MTKVSLHRFAKLPQRFLWALGLGVGILTAGAIAPPPSMTETEVKASATVLHLERQYTATINAAIAAEIFGDLAQLNAPAPLTVTLYTPTPSCDRYQGKEAAIVLAKAIPQVVHFLLAEQTPKLIDFELDSYQIQQNPKQQSIRIDLRRHPQARRHFISLSICERRILFGSLRETLLNNPDLQIREIQFTEGGQPIQI